MAQHDETTPRHGLSRRMLLQGGAALGLGITPILGEAAHASSSSQRVIRLAQRGLTHYTIYLGTTEDAIVRQAANELATYLGQITSAPFPVVISDTPPDNGQLIVVGRKNPLAPQIGATVDYAVLGDDGFALRTLQQSVLIAGASSRGTLYGTYWVLDRLLGVRWFAADHTVVPNNPTIEMPLAQLNDDHVPRFQYRQILAGDGKEPAYRQHNLLNGGRQTGGWAVPAPAGLDTWSTYWPEKSFGATFQTLVPDQTLWHGGQILCMDPRTREMAANSLVGILNQRIAAGLDASYGFEQQDALWTPDPASQAFADLHGGALSAPVIDMVNDVENRVRQSIPQARLGTHAYQFSFPTPQGIQPNPDIVMTLAPITADFGQPLLGAGNPVEGKTIVDWCSLSDNVLVWNYLVTFSCYIQPFPNWYAAAESIKQLAAHPSARGYMGQGAHSTVGAEFANMRIWVLARLLWDPSENIDTLIREFLNGYYGAAGEILYDYMRLMVASKDSTSSKLTFTVGVGSAYLNFATMRQADELMAAAEASVASNPAVRARVRNVRLGVDFIVLLRRAEYTAAAAAAGIVWDPDTTNRIARFDSALDASGLTRADVRSGTPAGLKEMVRLERVAAPRPVAAAGLPDSDWLDLQDMVLWRHPPVTTTVNDTLASDHYAIRMPGSVNAWGVQARLYLLPPEGQWRIFVSVRVNTGTAAPTATAFKAGVWPPLNNDVTIPVSQVADGKYHEFELPGTYSFDSSTIYAYVAPPASTAILDVYVDRMFVIRA